VLQVASVIRDHFIAASAGRLWKFGELEYRVGTHGYNLEPAFDVSGFVNSSQYTTIARVRISEQAMYIDELQTKLVPASGHEFTAEAIIIERTFWLHDPECFNKLMNYLDKLYAEMTRGNHSYHETGSDGVTVTLSPLSLP